MQSELKETIRFLGLISLWPAFTEHHCSSPLFGSINKQKPLDGMTNRYRPSTATRHLKLRRPASFCKTPQLIGTKTHIDRHESSHISMANDKLPVQTVHEQKPPNSTTHHHKSLRSARQPHLTRQTEPQRNAICQIITRSLHSFSARSPKPQQITAHLLCEACHRSAS